MGRRNIGAFKFFVVPHTHWDREWYRPLEHFRLELGEVVDGVLEVLERDPSFSSFTLDGQAVVLEDYLEVRPHNEQRLRAMVAAGRLEVGPSYVLPDEFLVSGESLVRNLLIGRSVCRRFGASPSPVGYLPDSFGHPLQLPQILAGFGIDTFVFMRGLGDQFDQIGAVFRWQAPDGSEVLAFQLLAAYSNFARLADADVAQARVRAIIERFGSVLERAGVSDVVLCNGDDHSPVQADLPSVCAELERLEGTKFTIASFADYVRAAKPPNPPTVTGELLGSRLQNVLRGVNSARLYLKRANQRAEQRLLAVEVLSALMTLRDRAPFPRADFELAWRDLLRCQPHDSICGCSCDEVHRDMLVRYESLERTVTLLEDRARQRSAAPGRSDDVSSVGVFNLLPYRRRGVVEVQGSEPVVVELDGFAARAAPRRPSPPLEPRDGASIESDRFRIEVAGDGTLTLLDKRTGQTFERLHELEDEHDIGDLYNFCELEGQPAWRSERAATRVLRDGPAVWELELRVEAERPAGLDEQFRPLDGSASLSVVTVVRLVQGSGRVEFRSTIDNSVRDHRLRVVFAAGVATAGSVRAEGQFAAVRRPLAPPRPQTEWVEPPDATQHTLGAVALGPIALLTKGLPEYEARASARGPELCLTLLRCVGTISRPSGAIGSRPHAAGPQVPTPDGQCLGRHEVQYALLPQADTLADWELLRAAQDYRCEFLISSREVLLDPPLSLEGAVVFSCLKGAEDGDGLILRCFNPGPATARARVAGGGLIVSRTRLDEVGERPLPDGSLELRGGEIGTIRLRAR